jgi:hypothetical protein
MITYSCFGKSQSIAYSRFTKSKNITYSCLGKWESISSRRGMKSRVTQNSGGLSQQNSGQMDIEYPMMFVFQNVQNHHVFVS